MREVETERGEEKSGSASRPLIAGYLLFEEALVIQCVDQDVARSSTSLLWQDVQFSLQPSVGGAASVNDTKKLSKLIKKAGSVLGTTLKSIELVVERRMSHKLLNIMENT